MAENEVKIEKEPLFSKKNTQLLSDPLGDNNPITVQVLGICSALAITAQMQAALKVLCAEASDGSTKGQKSSQSNDEANKAK